MTLNWKRAALIALTLLTLVACQGTPSDQGAMWDQSTWEQAKWQ